MPDPLISRRALGRALLERQFLLERTSRSTLEVVEQLVGLQSQAPTPPYVGLWSRMAHFQPSDLSTLVIDRRVVRLALMRSTIHVTSADDALWLRPTLQPALDQLLKGSYGRRLAGIDRAAVADDARRLLEEAPLTYKDLGAALGDRWPSYERQALNALARTDIPLVQVPPRSLWGSVGTPVHTALDQWLDRPDGPRPDEDLPAPARLVAQWDTVLLAHADRRRVLDERHGKRIFTTNGILHGTAWTDGRVAGIWRFDRTGGAPGGAVRFEEADG